MKLFFVLLEVRFLSSVVRTHRCCAVSGYTKTYIIIYLLTLVSMSYRITPGIPKWFGAVDPDKRRAHRIKTVITPNTEVQLTRSSAGAPRRHTPQQSARTTAQYI